MLGIVHMGVGLMLGLIFPILLGEVVILSPSELKLSAMGFYQSFYAIGIFVGPLIAGRIAEKIGLDEVFIFTAILSIIASAILLYIKMAEAKVVKKR
jgi:predicted MFS family arabinose efflux permease